MLRFTFTIFPSLHPNFGVSWENMGLEPPPRLICKKTMTTDQQPIKTNIYFSHFSDNFFHIFPYPIQILARHGKKWAGTNVVSLFSHTFFPFFSPTYLYCGNLRKKWGWTSSFHIHYSHPKSKFRHILGKNGLEAQPAKYSFVTASVFGHSIRQWDVI